MTQSVVNDILARRRDRTIAALLGVKEREADPFISLEARGALRKAILDGINEYHGFVIDILKSLDSGEVIINELYLQKLDDLHREIGVVRRIVETPSNGNGHVR